MLSSGTALARAREYGSAREVTPDTIAAHAQSKGERRIQPDKDSHSSTVARQFNNRCVRILCVCEKCTQIYRSAFRVVYYRAYTQSWVRYCFQLS